MENNFYKLYTGYATRFYWAKIVSERINYYKHYMRGFEGTIALKVTKGGRPGEFLGNDGILYIASERVLNLLQEQGFTGYGTYKVEVSGGKGDLPKYYGLAIYGKGGHILLKESEAECSYRPDGSMIIMGMKRLVFDESQWDGSDFFYLEESPGSCIVTERVKTAFKKAKLTNYELKPIEEVSFG